MAETSLYRRHRPQSFDQVVGQEHVVRTLRNAIERDRVHHAYLFVGSRGTGKTSMAKILARSLNCAQGPTVSPCGECESCRTIAAGSSLDVIEMDAASNRSVDDVRDLRERVGYAPAAGRWKVYILDEAHMLTREAWNAFLKTLEEPPPSTVFVLATTEAHKVMPTIVDRCQRFDFGRPSLENLAEVLQRTAQAEDIRIDAGAIGAIARAANGSFRDALGTLDQLVAYSGPQVETADVLAVLGVAEAELLFRTADALAAGDARAVLGILSELARSGRDPSRFAGDLVAHLRELLVIASVGEVPDHLFASEEHAARLAEQAVALSEVALLRAIDALSEAIAAVREGDDARMTVELALLRACRPEIDPSTAALAQRLERLERAGASADPPQAAASAPSVPAPVSAGPSAEPEPSRDDEPAAGGAGGAEGLARSAVAAVGAGIEEARSRVAGAGGEIVSRVGEQVEAAQAVSGDVDLEGLRGLWPAVVDQVRETGSELLAAAFQAARPVAVDAERGTVEIGFPPAASFNKRKAEAKENRDAFVEALRTIVGARLSPSYVVLDEEDVDPGPAAAGDGVQAGAPEAPPLDERELIERFKREFDAEELIEDPDEQEASPAAASTDTDEEAHSDG